MATILVVEDEYAIAELLRDMLQEEGYAVVLASNGSQALEQLAETRPDLILSDVMMPGMDGRALTRALRTDPHYRSIPIVLMSAGRAPDQGIDGYDAYISKPFNLYMVLDTVTELLGRGGSSPAR
ncbi:MAG: response regulator [Chloroflexota bacterium]